MTRNLRNAYDIQIYDIDTKRTIGVYDRLIWKNDIPYFIDGKYYFLLQNEILIVDNCGKIDVIQNYFSLVHYARVLDVFINIEYDVYKLNGGSFVKFVFKGDYERDYKLVPEYIKLIVDCLLDCGFVCDMVNEIYCWLLKLDVLCSLVY